ncbi:MAG: thiol reductant ABC exporter subunit CydD, partial [Agromyces sp.]
KNDSVKPFDLRLLRLSRAVRGIIGFGIVWALVHTAGIVLFAASATSLVVAWFSGGRPDWVTVMLGIIGGATLRAVAVWGSATTAARGAARAKAEFRELAMAALARGGTAALAGRSRSDVTLLLGRGLDALDDYFGSYLPQLLLALVSAPLLWATILRSDLESGVTVALVIPLIPLFMVLIGLATQSVQDAQWGALNTLGRQFLDLVDGLSTLKLFRRERAQARGIQEAGEEYRRRTMRVLRLSFLSGFTLELAATLSVALVAVLIGTRLVAGGLSLSVGLFVLLLVPDVFAPLRQVGASFHAAADGLTAATDVFAILETDAVSPVHSRDASATAVPGLRLEDFTVYRSESLTVGPLTVTFAPGTVHALVGPSGCGKSTLLDGILGFASSGGTASVNGASVTLDQLAWVPQRPSLSSGTIAANVAIGDPSPDAGLVRECLRRASAEDLDPERILGAGGAGLSGGQAQRVSIARAFYRLHRQPAVQTLLLDEPSSALDGDTQARLAAELRAIADAGISVIVVSHRDGLRQIADTVTTLGGAT